MSSFVPTFFSNFASNFKALQEKDYTDGESSLTFSNNVAGNVNLKSGVAVNGGEKTGFLSRSFPMPYSLGNLDARVDTTGNLEFSLENTTLVDKVSLGATSGFRPPKSQSSSSTEFDGCYLGVSAKHAREFVTGSLGVRTHFEADSKSYLSPRIDASLSVGYEGVSVGGAVTYDTASSDPKTAILSRGFGVEWAACKQNNFVVSAFSSAVNKYTVGAFAKLDKKTSVSVGVDIESVADVSASPEQKDSAAPSANISGALKLGVRYQLDANTSVIGRFNTKTNESSAQLEYLLPNPKSKISVNCAADASKRTLKGATWGVQVVLGDY